MNELDQQIDEYIAQLPAATRKILEDFDWVGKIQEIGDKHALLVDELGTLQIETTLTLIGLEDPANFQMNLRKRMNITDELAAALVREVNASIFLPIQEQVIESQKEKIEETELRFEAGQQITSDDALTHDDVLAEIEGHVGSADKAAPAPKKPQSVSGLKLANLFTKKPSPSKAPEKAVSSAPAPTYEGEDPYREPIN
jgi:hypothetical protein